jgi:hypothetical protein
MARVPLNRRGGLVRSMPLGHLADDLIDPTLVQAGSKSHIVPVKTVALGEGKQSLVADSIGIADLVRQLAEPLHRRHLPLKADVAQG